MNVSVWWQDTRINTMPTFRWFRRQAPKPVSALRVAIIPKRSISVTSFHATPSQSDPVNWLQCTPLSSTENSQVINLEPGPDRTKFFHSVSPGQTIDTTSTGITNHILPKNNGPTLVERLRLLLKVPLEWLLHGSTTLLAWPDHLMPFQTEGVQWLIERERILLADDMGLGKTVQAIAAIRILIVQRAIESALVVVPASLLDQWRRELSKWAPELRAIIIRGTPTNRAWQWNAQVHVALISYDTLLSDFTDNTQSPPRRKTWDLVVIDEAQRIKNRNVTSHMVKQIKRKRSWALTGTPLENEVDDLASILEFVDQGERTSTKHYSPGPKLLSRHKELQLRRKKADVLNQLPPKRVSKIAISLFPRQQESYDRAEKEGIIHLRELGGDVRIQHVLELITRLKQICNADPETGESAKLENIRDRLAILRQERNRAIIFSQYTSKSFGVGAIAKMISDFEPLSFTGDMSSQERERVIAQFKADDSHIALILSLRAGGLGLNLQEASYVFHLDRWWNPAIERQAEDRTHRYGQIVPVNVVKYMCIGTIEERIDAILEDKQQLFDEFIDDVSVDVAARLNSEELFGLFGLAAPRPHQKEHISWSACLELEERCTRILQLHGWSVQRTSISRDGDVDLIGTKVDEVGIEEIISIHCSDYAHPVGISGVRELIGVILTEGNVRAVLVSPSGVTAEAEQLAKQRHIIIWDELKLCELEGYPR